MSNEFGGLLEFGFNQGDENIVSDNKRFVAEANKNYHVSFGLWPWKADGTPDLDAPSPTFKGGKRLYREGVGYFLDKGPEWAAFAEKGSKTYIATIIILWPVDDDGVLDQSRLAAGKFHIKPWVFPRDKYNEVRRKHMRKHMGQNDLSIFCKEAGFQKFEFDTIDGNVLRSIMEGPDKWESFRKRIIEKVRELEATLGDEIGKNLSVQEIQERLAKRGDAAGVQGPSGVGNTSVNSEQIDDFVGDLLLD